MSVSCQHTQSQRIKESSLVGSSSSKHIHLDPRQTSCHTDRKVSASQSCRTLCNPRYYIARQAPLAWDPPGKNTGVGCHSLLQGIFPTQASNLDLLHHRQILYHRATKEALLPHCMPINKSELKVDVEC